MPTPPIAITAAHVALRAVPSSYPPAIAARLIGREKRQLGEVFGLRNFGVNLTRLLPGAISALRHAHSRQDEFVYILQGQPLLHTDAGMTQLEPGMCAGFKAGGTAHQLINDSLDEVWYLEVGDRSSGDEAFYPDDDLKALFVDGRWQFQHKEGQPYADREPLS